MSIFGHGSIFKPHCWHVFWRDRPWPPVVVGHGVHTPARSEVGLKPQAWIEMMERCCECAKEQPARTGYE